MLFSRLSFHVRSRTFRQVLLLLCLMSLVGLLVTQKNRIISGVYPSQSEERSNEELKDHVNKEDINKAANVTKSIPQTTRLLYPPTKGPSRPLTTKGPSLVNAVTSQSSRPQNTTRKIISSTYNLGDTYATDDMHVNSKCPNRIREKFRNAENLKEKFLEMVPVLQWKKHAQESEYERLRKFSGAQGWMGVTWHILNETLNLMNSTGNGYMFDTWNGTSPCIRCAVVGNGGILNGSRMGKEIDSHDYVFRVNGAITTGFETDVGNRTSFYFFGTNTMMNSLAAYGHRGFKRIPRTVETRFVLLPDHDRDYLLVRAALTNSIVDRSRDKGKDPAHYFGTNLTTEHFKILHPDFMRYLRNRFLWTPILNTKNRDIYRPSTGAAILLAAIHTCDQVSAFGFMTPNYQKFSDHYFDVIYRKVAFYANHNFRKEMQLWQDLHKAGIITLYMRD
ncbi:alpha-N-acetylgalactosaminide alpha-2,6-sialyltransferase 2 [Rana temporaria]|uniref:alpha-N-acetylgalactosaminide alpha-2,6-sialyltransferase 2 n=1 Tax=Rana temporaria TaxID=8407 RepID=UPI001AACF997|nr:alpha-N-acetylgalactosaminide alpha-2,6-sialyltransferase 2 [Rana temporaria]